MNVIPLHIKRVCKYQSFEGISHKLFFVHISNISNLLTFYAWPRIWVCREKNVDNIFMLQQISFESAHGKLDLSQGKKIVSPGISSKGRIFPIFEFFETNLQNRNLFQDAKGIR